MKSIGKQCGFSGSFEGVNPLKRAKYSTFVISLGGQHLRKKNQNTHRFPVNFRIPKLFPNLFELNLSPFLKDRIACSVILSNPCWDTLEDLSTNHANHLIVPTPQRIKETKLTEKVEPKRCLRGAVLENGSSLAKRNHFFPLILGGVEMAPLKKEAPFPTFFQENGSTQKRSQNSATKGSVLRTR